ncbi:hypothetical protein ACUNWD_08785 [Sunxiuqinia sp. A32]|uniref:hypothetical protein n=1 Tax=Sunxiuqinia sp. A32 TaxID=3461496 RepID=UPI0040466649
MNVIRLIFLSLVSLYLFSCGKTKDCALCFTPPQELNLKITDYSTGADLIFNHSISPDSIEFYYYQNNSKVTLEHETHLDSTNSRAIIVCWEISWMSPNGIKDFYLYLGNSDTDTLQLDIEERTNDCCTYFEWLDFKINENQMEIDPNDYLYNLRKQTTQN